MIFLAYRAPQVRIAFQRAARYRFYELANMLPLAYFQVRYHYILQREQVIDIQGGWHIQW